MPELRRQARIVYQASVRLRAPGREHSVVARVQNLSSRGLFVAGSGMPEPGTEVQCRMVIGGHRRTLRGRVAWVRGGRALDASAQTTPLSGPSAAQGAGIEFIELGPKDADLLRGLVEPTDHEQQSVDVWFEGLKAPIKSHAVVRSESLQISTRLPFLRLSSPVRVSFKHLGVEESRFGTLDSLTLDPAAEDGVPILCLNVSTPIADSVKGTIDVQHPQRETPAEGVLLSEPSTVIDPDVARPDAPPPPVPLVRVKAEPAPPAVSFTRVPVAATADQTQRVLLPTPDPDARDAVGLGTRGRRWRAAIGGFAIGALAIAAIGAIDGRLGRATGPARRAPTGLAAPAVAAPSPRDPTMVAGGRSGPAATPVEPSTAGPLQATAVPAGKPPAAAVPPPTTAAAEPPTAAPPAGALGFPPQRPRPTIERLADGAPDSDASPRGLDSTPGQLKIEGPPGATLDASTDGTRTTVIIPISGSGRGASRYQLADPPGAGLHLPRARLRVAAGIYALDAGPLRRLWLRGRGAGSNVRAYFDPSLAVADLRVQGSTLKLVVRSR